MKKSIILSIAAAAVCALAFSISCNNLEEVTEPDPEPETPGEIILHATVADPGGDDSGTSSDSKAYFSNSNWVWEGGDIIQIWYDSNTGTTPDALMGYDAKNKKWIFTKSGSPKSSGTLKALYRHGDVGTGTANANEITLTTTSDYTYSTIGNENHFYCDLKDWKYLSEIQVILSDLNSNKASKYTLACNRFKPITGYEVREGDIIATTGAEGNAVAGISNKGGGVAFVFATCACYGQTKTYKFSRLMNDSNNYTIEAIEKSKALSRISNNAKIKSIKLSGTWTRADYTQLSADGPKWANFNLGSTISTYENQTECTTSTVGGIYRYLGTNNLRDNTRLRDDHLDEYTSSNDPATKIWGSHWRMPTADELYMIYESFTYVKRYNATWCDGTTTQYCQGCTIPGWKISGKGDYANASIFLPNTFNYSYNRDYSQWGYTIPVQTYYGGYYWAHNDKVPAGMGIHEPDRRTSNNFNWNSTSGYSTYTQNFGDAIRPVYVE